MSTSDTTPTTKPFRSEALKAAAEAAAIENAERRAIFRELAREGAK